VAPNPITIHLSFNVQFRRAPATIRQVITTLQAAGHFTDPDRIYRARFSALTTSAIKTAFLRPERPDAAAAAAVDARQELDLKIGCSFTRLLTRQLVEGAKITFGEPRLTVISYGPCQTPTLSFCVERQRAIDAFVPRQYWEVEALFVFAIGRDPCLCSCC